MESTPNFLLKIIPHVDGSVQICELVSHNLQDVKIKEAYSGKGCLELFSHAMAPVNDLPCLEVLSCVHFVSDLTLPFGKVIHNYLKN
jgi:acetoacetate decarboxylase